MYNSPDLNSMEMEEIQTITKKVVETTMTLADASRAMRGEMGRMTEEIYIAQLRIIEGLRKEYEAAGVNVNALNQWYREQARVLEIEYLQSIESVWAGFKAAGMQIKNEIKTWGEKAFEFSITLEDSISRGLENSLRNFSSWKDSLLSMFEEIYWAAIRIAFIQPIAQGLAGGMTAALGGMFQAPAGSAVSPFVAPKGSFGAPTGLQRGGTVEKTGWAVVHEGETFSGVGNKDKGGLTININNEGMERVQVSQAEEYYFGDQRIVDIIIQKAGTDGGLRRAIAGASR